MVNGFLRANSGVIWEALALTILTITAYLIYHHHHGTVTVYDFPPPLARMRIG